MADLKITSKFQVTIPQEIRELLGLKAGDRVIFEIKKDKQVRIKKSIAVDDAYLRSQEKTLEKTKRNALCE